MKTKITETITKEIDIELPAYRHDGICFWYKIISEKSIVAVFKSSAFEEANVQMHSHLTNALALKNVEITEREFNDKFNEAMQILHQTVYGQIPFEVETPKEELLCEEVKHNAKEKANGNPNL